MDRLEERVSVVVPCFNEGPKIRRNLTEICDFLSSFAPDHEVVAVDDGSTDDTFQEILRAAAMRPAIRPFHYPENTGKGFALREGFAQTTGRYVVFLDADLDLHPRQLARFFEMLFREHADVVIGNKRHRDSVVDYPKRRQAISFLYSLFLRLLFDLPVQDTQAGLKLFRREVLEQVFSKIVCKRFAFDVEVLANAHRLGYKIVEASIELNFTRVLQRGRITWSDLWNTGWDTLAIYYRMYWLKYYDRPHWNPSQFPSASIVVVATGEEDGLETCVNACLDQAYPVAYDVVLVTNRPLQVQRSGSLRLVQTDASSRATMREVGRQQATGAVVAFLEAPWTPVKHWLERAVRNFGDADIAAVSGPSVTSPALDGQTLSGLRWITALFGQSALRYRYISRGVGKSSRLGRPQFIVRRNVLDQMMADAMDCDCLDPSRMAQWMTQELNQTIAYDPEVLVYLPQA